MRRSNSLPRNKITDRVNILRNYIRGKTVLHIGCTDSPETKEKIENHSLLHYDLVEVAKNVSGIDIDEESIKIMRNNGIDDVYCEDIYKLNENKFINENKFDYIIFSEVIEHLPNAGLALEILHKFIANTNKETILIITAPNIHNFFFRIIEMLKNKESVHPDHYCYYSYSTLSKLLRDSGFAIIDSKYVLYRKKSIIYKPFLGIMNLFTSSFMPYILFKCKIKQTKI
ncbi:MAG: methyltransferase domain-containing protein [Bacteroidales bacterium]|jgi:2-polyprenyl-3-methyl-5-hydroxy-6-metoxy-1,4-benzoquinol methylase